MHSVSLLVCGWKGVVLVFVTVVSWQSSWKSWDSKFRPWLVWSWFVNPNCAKKTSRTSYAYTWMLWKCEHACPFRKLICEYVYILHSIFCFCPKTCVLICHPTSGSLRSRPKGWVCLVTWISSSLVWVFLLSLTHSTTGPISGSSAWRSRTSSSVISGRNIMQWMLSGSVN